MSWSSTEQSLPEVSAPTGVFSRLAMLGELGKLRLSLLVLWTVGVGFLMAGGGSIWLLIVTLVGVGSCSVGSAALNMYLERRHDELMDRTADRPLPTRRISADQVLAIGVASVVLGLAVLAAFANSLAMLLTAASVIIYVVCYTPLKRLTTLNTFVGAVTGALPPMIGWVTARGAIDDGAWALFAILFVWQIPHFLALAWIYRSDYGRAGFKMLSVADVHGYVTTRQVFLFAMMMIPVSLVPSLNGITGVPYFYGALVLGIGFLATAIRLLVTRSDTDAKRVFVASLIYLPSLFGLMLIDAYLLA